MSMQASILSVLRDEYFYITDSRKGLAEPSIYHMRALKDFEVTDVGTSPKLLAESLERDGFAEIIPDVEVQDGIDFAFT